MKAVTYHQYGSPDVLQLGDVTTPSPAAGDVLVRVVATTVASEDVTFRRGFPFVSRLATGLLKPGKPVLGTQFAGVVEATGADVTRFVPGDEVFGDTGPGFGAHAEYVVVPAEGAIQPKPESLDFAEAVAVAGGELTALAFLRDEGGLRAGQRVLVIGASGSVGSAAVQLAHHMGAHVTAVTSTRNDALVRSLGADAVIDYTREDFTKAQDPWHIIFDAVGASSYGHAKDVLAPDGKYLSTVLSATMVMDMLRTRGKRARIAFTGLRNARAKREDLAYISSLIAAGELRPVIDRTYPFEQASEAHAYVEKGHKRGNVVLTVGEA